VADFVEEIGTITHFLNVLPKGVCNARTLFFAIPPKKKVAKNKGVGQRTLLNSKFPQSYLRKIRVQL